MRRLYRQLLPVSLLILMLLLTACSSDRTSGAASGSGAASSPNSGTAAPVLGPRRSLKVGYLNVMDDAPAMLAKDAGLYEKYGLDVDLVLFESGTDLIKAIVGGQLQAGVLGFTNAVTWAAKGADLKVVGGAQMGYHSLLVRKDSGIKTVQDLKGKRIASQKQGSTADIVLNGVVFRQAGLSRQDVQMVYVEPAAAIQSLVAGQVDAAFVFEPYEQIARTTGNVDVIYEIGKVWPFPCMVVITSGQQLAGDREDIDRLLDAQKDAIEMLETRPDEAARYLVKRFVQDEELQGPSGSVKAVDLVRKAIETQTFRGEISDQDIRRMEEIVAIMVSQGLIERKIDMNTILDLTWQKRAANNGR